MAWLTGWEYRALVEIPGVGSELSNYQVNITIPYETGKMKTDFGDIRFTSSDGETLLNYHLASKEDGVNADFVVKIPTISASPASTNVYIYSGKSDAVTTSEPDNTYVFFDDFTGDLGKWDTIPGGWSIENNKLKSTLSGTAYAIISDADDLIISATINTGTDSGVRRIRVSNSLDSTYNSLWARYDYNQIQQIKTGEGVGGTVSQTLNNNTDYLFEFKKISGTWSIYVDGSLKNTKTGWASFTPYYIAFSNESNYTTYYSNIIVRKTASDEPSFTDIGEWETHTQYKYQDLKGYIEIEYYTADLKGLLTVRRETSAHIKGFLCVQHFYSDLKGILSVRAFSSTDLMAYLYVPPYIKRYKYYDVTGEITVEEIGPYQEFMGEIIVGEILRRIIPVKGRVIRETPETDPTDPSQSKELDEKMVIMIGDGIYV